MAAKLGKEAASPVSRNAVLSPSGQIPDLLARGRRHHQAGQLAEAEECYRKLLAIDPDHFDGLHFLGIAAQQLGRSDIAASLIGKALALHDQGPALHDTGTPGRSKPAVPRRNLAAAHSNLGIVLTAVGNLPAALKAIQRSLQLEETENAKLLFVGCLRNLTV